MQNIFNMRYKNDILSSFTHSFNTFFFTNAHMVILHKIKVDGDQGCQKAS